MLVLGEPTSYAHFFPNKKEIVNSAESFQSQSIAGDEMFDQLFNFEERGSTKLATDQNREIVDDTSAKNEETGQKHFSPMVNELDSSDSDLIRPPSEEENLSWLVQDKKVPVLRGIRSDICRHLFLTNFSNHSGSIIRHKVSDSFETNLHASDYATLASSIYNYDEYLSLDTVSLVLQATPGGLSLVNPEIQKNHLRVLCENIVEKFEPKYLIIFSPLIPENLSGFIVDGDETKNKIEQVIRIIKEFCDNHPAISKTKLVHYSLQDAFSVNGSVSETLFFQPGDPYEFNSYGYSTLGNILNIVTKSLIPQDIKTVEPQFESRFRPHKRLSYLQGPETTSSFGYNDGVDHDYRSDYRPRSRKYNRYQGSDDELNSSDDYFMDSRRYKEQQGYRPPRKSYRDREQFVGPSRYGSKSRYSESNQNFKEYLRNKERYRQDKFDGSYSESPENESSVDPYHQGYKLVQKSRYGDKTGFAGKYKVNYTNDSRLRPRTPYKLDRDEDSYVFLDTDE